MAAVVARALSSRGSDVSPFCCGCSCCSVGFAATSHSFERSDGIDALAKVGGEPAMMGPDEFTANTKSDMPKWQEVVKASGVHLD